METLSESSLSLSREQAQQRESISTLNSRLSQSTGQVQQLQEKLEAAKRNLGKVMEEKDEEGKRREKAESELVRHERENRQMKQQFDSAIALMESKLSDQEGSMSKLRLELNQKDSALSSLREEFQAETRQRAELKERLGKVSADYKVTLERSRLLDGEKVELQQSLAHLKSQYSHLEHTHADLLSEREALQLEHHRYVPTCVDVGKSCMY